MDDRAEFVAYVVRHCLPTIGIRELGLLVVPTKGSAPEKRRRRKPSNKTNATHWMGESGYSGWVYVTREDVQAAMSGAGYSSAADDCDADFVSTSLNSFRLRELATRAFKQSDVRTNLGSILGAIDTALSVIYPTGEAPEPGRSFTPPSSLVDDMATYLASNVDEESFAVRSARTAVDPDSNVQIYDLEKQALLSLNYLRECFRSLSAQNEIKDVDRAALSPKRQLVLDLSVVCEAHGTKAVASYKPELGIRVSQPAQFMRGIIRRALANMGATFDGGGNLVDPSLVKVSQDGKPDVELCVALEKLTIGQALEEIIGHLGRKTKPFNVPDPSLPAKIRAARRAAKQRLRHRKLRS